MQLNKAHVKGKWNYFMTNWGLSDLVRKEISTMRHHDPGILGFVDPISQAPVQNKSWQILLWQESLCNQRNRDVTALPSSVKFKFSCPFNKSGQRHIL